MFWKHTDPNTDIHSEHKQSHTRTRVYTHIHTHSHTFSEPYSALPGAPRELPANDLPILETRQQRSVLDGF